MTMSDRHYRSLARLGYTLYAHGQPGRARRIFRGLTSVSPKRGYAWRLLAACRHRLADASGSASAYERALEVDPSDSAARIGFAILLAEHDRLDDAAALLEPLSRRAGGDSAYARRARALLRRWRLERTSTTESAGRTGQDGPDRTNPA